MLGDQSRNDITAREFGVFEAEKACRKATIIGRTNLPTHYSLFLRRGLRELFDQFHNLTDPEEVVRRSKICEVDFLPPGSAPRA